MLTRARLTNTKCKFPSQRIQQSGKRKRLQIRIGIERNSETLRTDHTIFSSLTVLRSCKLEGDDAFNTSNTTPTSTEEGLHPI